MTQHILSDVNNQISDKQYYQTLSIIDYLLEECSNSTQNAIVSPDELRQLKQELIQNREDLNPAQLNTAILMLLDYVIKTIKSL